MKNSRKPLIVAELDDQAWTLVTEDSDIIHSLTCKRPSKSKSWGWTRESRTQFTTRMQTYPEIRASLYRLTMRATTYDFQINGSSNHCSVIATDDGYVDTLPKLAKHSQLGRSGRAPTPTLLTK